MKLLHMTDIHLRAPGETVDGHDPIANFQRALDHALQQHPDAAASIITGDLSDRGSAEDYGRLRAMLAEAPIPVHYCIGNHDDRATFLAEFPECACPEGFAQSTAPLPLGHAIMLDTFGPASAAGHFCARRAAWLEQQLHSLPGPIWIFMHHNPVPIEVAPMDRIMLLDSERFAGAVVPHKDKIRHIFHGHCHLHLNGAFHGIPFSAPRSTNNAAWPDFTATSHYSGSDMTQSYSVIFATPDTTMVHMVEFGYEGEIRTFSGT